MKKNLLALSLLGVALFAFPNFFVDISTTQVDGKHYTVYEFGPEFTLGPVLIGFTLTTYPDFDTGVFYYGRPTAGATPSTNIFDGLNITALGLDLGTVWFRYGRMFPLTYGMAFVVNGYQAPNVRTVDGGVRLGGLSVSVHVPYQLRNLSGLQFDKSDSVHALNAVVPFGALRLSAYGVLDDENGAPIKYFAGSAITIEFLGLSIGAEGGAQIWKDDKVSFGGFAGIFGNFGVVSLVAGPYYASDGFVPWILDKNYRVSKPTLTYSAFEETLGYIFRIGLTVEPYGKVVMSLKGNFNGGTSLNGEGVIRIPALGGTNGLVLYGYLYDNTPFEGGRFLDGDTSARLILAYPLLDNLFAGVRYVWNGAEFTNSAFLGTAASF